MKQTIFTEDQFIATRWQTTQDKAHFANQLVAFIESGYKISKFNRAFYSRLSQCFGFIAHYNKAGFYAEYFEDLSGQLNFRDRIRLWRCYGSPDCTYSDVERAVQAYLRVSYAH